LSNRKLSSIGKNRDLKTFGIKNAGRAGKLAGPKPILRLEG